MAMPILPFLITALGGIALSSCGNSEELEVDSRAGEADPPIPEFEVLPCYSKTPNQPFLVSVNGKKERAEEDAFAGTVSNDGVFSFRTSSRNFFPDDALAMGEPHRHSQVFFRHHADLQPVWASRSAILSRSTRAFEPKIAGNLLAFHGDPSEYGFPDSGDSSPRMAPILYRLSDGLRTYLRVPAGNPQEKDVRWWVPRGLAALKEGGYRLLIEEAKFYGDSLGLPLSLQVYAVDVEESLIVREVKLLSQGPDGQAANALAIDPVMSPNGRFVNYSSRATNLSTEVPPNFVGSLLLYHQDLLLRELWPMNAFSAWEPAPENYSYSSGATAASMLAGPDDQSGFWIGGGSGMLQIHQPPDKIVTLNGTVVVPFHREVSADGRYLLLEERGPSPELSGPYELLLRNTQSHAVFSLDRSMEKFLGNSSISPNGRWMIWEKGEGQQRQVYGMEVCDERELTRR